MLNSVIVLFANDFAYVVAVLFLVFLYVTYYSRRQKIEIFLVTAISSVIARFGVTELIRYFYHHPRPYLVLPGVHQLLIETSWSFPSGHATFFFAMAMAIYFYNKKWGSVFFGAAILMTVSRVIAGIHYPSDIISGAIIGIIVACVTFYFARRIAARRAHQTY